MYCLLTLGLFPSLCGIPPYRTPFLYFWWNPGMKYLVLQTLSSSEGCIQVFYWYSVIAFRYYLYRRLLSNYVWAYWVCRYLSNRRKGWYCSLFNGIQFIFSRISNHLYFSVVHHFFTNIDNLYHDFYLLIQ